MLDLKALLSKILNNSIFKGDLVVENYTHPISAMSSGQNMVWSDTKTEEGYYPIGVVGYYSGSGQILIRRAELTSRSSGSCSFTFAGRSVATVNAGTCNIRILWVRDT